MKKRVKTFVKDYYLKVSFIFLSLFIVLAISIYINKSPTTLDLITNNFVKTLQTPFLSNLAISIGDVFNPYLISTASILIAISFFFKRKIRESRVFVLLMLLNALSGLGLKYLIEKTRPIDSLLFSSEPAFPSGHTSTAIVFFGFLFYIYRKHKNKNKILIPAVIIALITIISLSRLYINIHWLTDIIGGALLGLFWLFLGIFLISKD